MAFRKNHLIDISTYSNQAWWGTSSLDSSTCLPSTWYLSSRPMSTFQNTESKKRKSEEVVSYSVVIVFNFHLFWLVVAWIRGCLNKINFIITDFKNEINVVYSGIIPNLFQENKGVVAEGVLKDKSFFEAEKILAKHDENYMPPEVKASLGEN